MNIKLVAIDLDGTTFDNQGNISQKNVDAIEHACSQGVFVVPATGRAFFELPSQINACKGIQYFVTSNGASVTDRAGTVIVEHKIKYELAVQILELIKEYDIMTELYIDGHAYTKLANMNEATFRHYKIQPKYFSVLLEARTGVADVLAYLHTKQASVEKFNLFFSKQAERQTFLQRMEAMNQVVEITNSMTNNLEINAFGANKGTGLEQLCKVLSISPCEVLAIGDSDNDVSMFHFAHTAVAVANACDELKKVATHHTVSNDEHAVATAINEFAELLL